MRIAVRDKCQDGRVIVTCYGQQQLLWCKSQGPKLAKATIHPASNWTLPILELIRQFMEEPYLIAEVTQLDRHTEQEGRN
ncbi:hypothetical protein OS493_015623 [Desmophyllum pertusum]|uniref:Uncharacterized protein n=1 Tax=Desmophyllum pertusum TaxID=174260 RepID=A0A9X0CKS5_9CNID|nr:hypothetical protein OS493_015623 [Desmophyllum pertusum]